MLPVIAIVGRPNVGKSTLFNRLTRTRSALVSSMPGLTRDRQYGEGQLGNKLFIVIDTGGLDFDLSKFTASQKKESYPKDSDIEVSMAKQSLQAITEADKVLFLADARTGLVAGDSAIASLLRKYGKKVYLTVNKIDGIERETASSDFYELGLGKPYLISAEHGLGINDLISDVLDDFPEQNPASNTDSTLETKDHLIKIAFIGRPNAGKSTLINRILGEERVIVSKIPGTTRDSIFINFTRHGDNYILIDTAGVRRRSRVKEKIEKFSVVKTLQAIAAADVAVMLIDAKENIADQDLWLLGFVIDSGKALVIALNKWDNLERKERTAVHKELDRRLAFAGFAKIHYISALHGSGVGDLFASIKHAYKSASQAFETPKLTQILQRAVVQHMPPIVRGRRIKLRYAHAGGRNPPLIIIHGNQTQDVPEDYRRYLANYFRKALRLTGIMVRIEFKSGKNPYKK